MEGPPDAAGDAVAAGKQPAQATPAAGAANASAPEPVLGTPTIVGIPAQDSKHQDVRSAFNYQHSVASAWWQQWYQWYARNHGGAASFAPLQAIPPLRVMRGPGAPAAQQVAAAAAHAAAECAPADAAGVPELRRSIDERGASSEVAIKAEVGSDVLAEPDAKLDGAKPDPDGGSGAEADVGDALRESKMDSNKVCKLFFHITESVWSLSILGWFLL
jgi:hypothetical protein